MNTPAARAVRAPGPGSSSIARAYVELTKPRIIELLLITTLPAMVLAADGWPGTALALVTLAGGALSAGGANAINQYLDRDIDGLMGRTRRRPLPTDRLGAGRALAFGVALGAVGFGWLALTVNLLAAVLATSGLLFYVFVYTLFLKRTTPQNIVIGGAAGAVPTLVGWAAVEGSVGVPALVLFAVVFFWTPPHFWALSLRYRDEYAAAGVPMLPVVAGEETTLRQIVRYTVSLAGVTLLLYATGSVGWLYLVASTVLNLVLIAEAVRLAAAPVRAMRFFVTSNAYLALLFASVAVDVVVLGPESTTMTGSRLVAFVIAALLIAGAVAAVVGGELRLADRRSPRRLVEVLLPALAVIALMVTVWVGAR